MFRRSGYRFADKNMRQSKTLEHVQGHALRSRARGNPRVDGDDGAAGVTGALGSEEGDRVGDFFRVRGAAERERLDQVAPGLRIAGLVLRLLAHERNEA